MPNTKRIRLIVVLILAFGLLSTSTARRTAAKPTPTLVCDIQCYALGHGRMQCEAIVEGGTGSYSYAWTPTPTAGGEAYMISNCTQWQYYNASVTVTDSGGATFTDSDTFYCGTPQ